jgi:hypothetical protein
MRAALRGGVFGAALAASAIVGIIGWWLVKSPGEAWEPITTYVELIGLPATLMNYGPISELGGVASMATLFLPVVLEWFLIGYVLGWIAPKVISARARAM